jgi:hypothetical protein
MTPDSFPELDVTSWEVIEVEQLGSKPYKWWLRKPVRWRATSKTPPSGCSSLGQASGFLPAMYLRAMTGPRRSRARSPRRSGSPLRGSNSRSVRRPLASSPVTCRSAGASYSATSSCPDTIRHTDWWARVAGYSLDSLDALLARVPDARMSRSSRMFARSLVAENQRRLLE